jgi:hypothetical protein
VSSPRAQPHTHAPATGRSSSSKSDVAAVVRIALSSMPVSVLGGCDNDGPLADGGWEGGPCLRVYGRVTSYNKRGRSSMPGVTANHAPLPGR